MQIIILTLVFLLFGCSKDVKKIPDQSPQFEMESSEIKLLGIENTVVNLKRTDVEHGPIIEINFDQKQKVVKSERNLVCGKVELKGRTYSQKDPRMFYLKLSESEFPGFQSLPINAQCKLIVKLENENGSTAKKTLNLQLNFDAPQYLEVTKQVAGHKSIYLLNAGLLLLDKQEIKNPHPNPVIIKYIAESHCFGFIGVNPVNNNNVQATSRHGEPFALRAERIEISGQYRFIEGDYKNSVLFELAPGKSVLIQTYSESFKYKPQQLTHNTALGSVTLNVSAAMVDHCVNHSELPGLYLWADTEKTGTETKEPAKYVFPAGSIGTLPRMGVF